MGGYMYHNNNNTLITTAYATRATIPWASADGKGHNLILKFECSCSLASLHINYSGRPT